MGRLGRVRRWLSTPIYTRPISRVYPEAEVEVKADGAKVRVMLSTPDGSAHAYFCLTPETAWLLGNQIVDVAREIGRAQESAAE